MRESVSHIYETLVSTDEQGKLQPSLAAKWEVPNPQTIRFHLRKGIKFHNGEPLDAAAARSVLRTLAFYYGTIVPPQFAKQNQDRFSVAIGTGPYRMVQYRPGDRLVVERNPDYWGKAPGVARIVFRVVPEAGTRLAALERGEVDIAANFPIDQIDRFRESRTVGVMSKPSVRVAFVGMRVDRESLRDVRVRRALAMAINAPELNKALLAGLGRAANTVITPEVFGYAKAVAPPAWDVRRAKQLLAEAGHPSLHLRMGLSNGRFLNDRQIGEAIAAGFTEVGVRVELDAPEFGTFWREMARPNSKYDAYVVSWGVTTLDAEHAMTPLFHQRFSSGYNSYQNEELSALIDRARAAVDDNVARDLYERIQQGLMRDLPWIPVVVVPEVIGVRRAVEGVRQRADELIFFWGVTKR